MGIRSVALQHEAPLDRPAPGFHTRNFGPANLGRAMDPFINLDEFVMTEPIFRAHPHAGFSAITYLFEDAEGSFLNRWSRGDDQLIGPGAVHWTQAGSGMLHEEVPTVSGRSCHGLQMFVKLPAALELSPPVAFHLDADEVPEVREGGCRVRVLAGSWRSTTSPMAVGNDVDWLDVHLVAGAEFSTPAPAAHTAFIVVVHGAVAIGGRSIGPHCGAVLASDGDEVAIRATAATELLYCAGPPLREPFVSSGPFMLRDEDRLRDAARRLRAGGMGQLDPSF